MGITNYVVIEPFYGGSHKQLVDLVFRDVLDNTVLLTSPDKKWHWKARTSSLFFSQKIPTLPRPGDLVLFTSSVLNLAELVALRPDLLHSKKIIYFHENQLQYPVRKDQHRDFQYGYNQILSSLVADVLLFNSQFNVSSFIAGIPAFLRQIPDSRPDPEQIVEQIRLKSRVLYFAMDLPQLPRQPRSGSLHIIWPHRWEHDKDPELLFSCLIELHKQGLQFRLSILGEQYEKNPDIFSVGKEVLCDHIENWGYQSSKEDYYRILGEGHVVLSTAKHEFFGVAMLEAVHLGCYPIAPNNLVYPEHFPEECLYRTTAQLSKKLRYFCRYPEKVPFPQVDVAGRYSWDALKLSYTEILGPREMPEQPAGNR